MSAETLSALTPEQVEQYHRDGYLVLRQLITPAEAGELLQRLEDLATGKLPLPSGINMQVEPVVQRGEAEAPSFLESLRKVERLAIEDDLFRRNSRDPRLLNIARDLLGPDLKLFRDALMMKPPHHGSAKPYHQDSVYWRIEPRELGSYWLALDEATPENGCMRVLRGSHQWGELEHKHLGDFQVEEDKLDTSTEVIVPLQPGDALFFHSMLLHATSPNTSDQPRRAMIYSLMEAHSRWTGDPQKKPEFPLLCGREYPGCV